METLFPISLRRISEIADNATVEAQAVVDRFAQTQAVIRELTLAGFSKQGRTDETKRATDLKIEIEKKRKEDAERQKEENTKAQENLKKGNMVFDILGAIFTRQ